uniref:Transcription initiation factor IIF subunit alpha n=1 Tax=Plectus sambesii TaxID=2011161 RepID=A0A914WUE1_9BILA
MASGNRPNEFTVRVPVHDDAKNYSVLKFNESLGVDVGNWSASGTNVRMVREDNRTVKASTATKQDYGAGSEFGRAARDEARRKKYGRQLRGYHHDDQPWRLSIEATDGKVRRFRSIRDAGAGDHADYWVFLKSGEGLFDAFKVDDWYQFLPEITHKTLDIDQAEEQFTHRSKVMNQFALKAQIQAKMVKDEDEEKMDTKPKNL